MATPPDHDLASVGLCTLCSHARVVVSARASRFWRCGRADNEAERFPKYPRLPVVSCVGFEHATAGGGRR